MSNEINKVLKISELVLSKLQDDGVEIIFDQIIPYRIEHLGKNEYKATGNVDVILRYTGKGKTPKKEIRGHLPDEYIGDLGSIPTAVQFVAEWVAPDYLNFKPDKYPLSYIFHDTMFKEHIFPGRPDIEIDMDTANELLFLSLITEACSYIQASASYYVVQKLGEKHFDINQKTVEI